MSDPASRPEPLPSSPARRRFVRLLGLGGVVGLFATALGGLVADAVHGQTAPKSAPPPPAPPPAPSDEARALHAILVGRYGTHLDAGQKESLLTALESSVQSGKTLRAKKLANAVEPDVVFAARMPDRDRRGGAQR